MLSLSLSLTHTHTHTHSSVSTKGVLVFENTSSKSTKVYWILSKFHAFDEVLLHDIPIQTSWTPCKWRREGGGPALIRHTSIRQCTISLSPQIFRGMYYYFHLTDEKSAYDYAASYQQGQDVNPDHQILRLGSCISYCKFSKINMKTLWHVRTATKLSVERVGEWNFPRNLIFELFF